MQIVINIKEDFLYEIKHKHPNMRTELEQSVLDGTILPKGHGKLIDADEFIKQESCCGYIEDMDIDYFKQKTPTIIEADK